MNGTLAAFHFLRPLWLLALPLLWWSCWRLRLAGDTQAALKRLCDPALLPWISVNSPTRQTRARLLGLAAGGTLALLALAGPTWQRLPQPVFREESALVIALNLSSSMEATDLAPSRLTRARYKIRDLLAARDRGQTALVVYAGHPFAVTPLTDDVNTLSAQLDVMTPDLMPLPGHDAALAVAEAIKLLTQAGLPRGDVLLVTDEIPDTQAATMGRLLDGSPWRLSILGVGTSGGAPVPTADGDFAKDTDGKLLLSRLDEPALRRLAEAHQGRFVAVANDASDVQTLTQWLASAPTGAAAGANHRLSEQWNDLGPWLLPPVLLLAAAALGRRQAAGAVLLCALIGAPPARADWWFSPDQAGFRAWSREDYATAASRFDNPDWRAAARYRAGDYTGALAELAGRDTPQALYNRANALARLGKYEDALKAYEEALKANPDDEDAKYNKSLVEEQLRKQQQPEEDQQSAQQPKDGKGDQGEGQSQDQGKQASANRKDSNMSAPNQGEQDPSQDGERQQGKEQARREHSREDGRADRDQASRASEGQGGKSKPTTEATAANAAHDEESMATDQWLRQIPDDPGGLWRRKFQYQYQRQYGGQSGKSDSW